MSARVADWIERELDRVRPERLVITFFGGEPLLNLPVLYDLADRLWAATQQRGVRMMTSIITNGLLLTTDIVDRLVPRGLKGVKITLDGDRDTHNRMRPLRGGQGTFDRIVENIRQVAAKVPDFDRRQLRRDVGGQLSGAAPVSARAGFRRQAREGQFQAGDPNAGAGAEGHPAADAGRTADGKPLGGTCMTSAGAGGGGTACDSCNVPRRPADVSARGNEAARLSDAGRGTQRPVPCAYRARAHDRSGRIALRVPRVHGRARPVDGAHRRPSRSATRACARTIRPPGSVERVRRLRVHPRLCGGVPGGIAHRAWRHEQADMSQALIRIGAHFAGAYRGQRSLGRVQ